MFFYENILLLVYFIMFFKLVINRNQKDISFFENITAGKWSYFYNDNTLYYRFVVFDRSWAWIDLILRNPLQAEKNDKMKI